MHLQDGIQGKNRRLIPPTPPHGTNSYFLRFVPFYFFQQRSNKAIHDRDESNYALKEALLEVEKYKSRLKIAESLIGSGRPKENNKKSLITPISVGMTTILAIVIFGRRFN